jgi:predicted amidohydrolase YtcJ
VFALAAIAEAEPLRGDRIEHASIVTDFSITEIARLGLQVVTQPHFIAERGDAYVDDVVADSHEQLYRLHSFLANGIVLAGGSDAPFGSCDPWDAMQAAVTRETPTGRCIGKHEALTPEEALDLYLRAPHALEQRRRITVGATADLCLLDRPWQAARQQLSSQHVRATFIDGRAVFQRASDLLEPPPQVAC